MMFFNIITEGCVKGYGIVRDFLGNTWFYGSIEQCKEFISEVEGVNYEDSGRPVV